MLSNDIPFYHPGVPDGFAIFCSQNEYMQVLSHIKTERYKIQLQKKKEKEAEIQILKTEPEPNKKEFLCQICKSRFDNYLDHIKSNLHSRNKTKYRTIFNNIKLTFKRIVDYNNTKKNNNINLIKEEKSEKTNNINICENNAIATTKEESYSLNDDNKIGNITKDKSNNLKTISEKGNDQSNEKNKDISVKEILNILETIDNKEKSNNIIKVGFHKRKKNEKNKYFLTENYIHDLKSITAKIHVFNNLLDMNK